VTEAITGLDLVEWQLRVAAGAPLPLRQNEVRWQGHAIEARLYAEDPYDGFAPQTGRIAYWRPQRALRAGRADAGTQGLPAAAPCSVRIDDGIREGGVVAPFYDALLAKVIVHGRDRADALRRLAAALEDAPLLGLRTNVRYLRDLARHPEFVAGAVTTGRLDEWAERGAAINVAPQPEDLDWVTAAALRALGSSGRGGAASGAAPASGACALGLARRRLDLRCAGRTRTLFVDVRDVRGAGDAHAAHEADGADGAHAVAAVDVHLDERSWQVRLHAADADGWRAIAVDGLRRQQLVLEEGGRVHLVRDAAVHVFDEASPFPQPDAAAAARVARAPVAGVVAQLSVRPGERVVAGQPLACVEAMKMEMWLHAAAVGVVAAVHVGLRDTVAAGAVLVELELDGEPGQDGRANEDKEPR